MVALSITAAQVVADEAGAIQYDDANEAITPGQAIYYDATLRKWRLADADAVATVPANRVGIAISQAAAAGQGVGGQKTGSVTLGAGAAPVVGTAYYVGPTAGSIVPEADVLSGDFPCLLGFGSASNKLKMHVFSTEEAKA